MRKLFVSLILFSVFGHITASNVLAQIPNAFSLGIFPPILEINADPPAKVESTITIQNLSENTRDVAVIFKSFRLSDDGRARIEYISDDNEIIGPDPLILQKVKLYEEDTPVTKVTLEPLESKNLTLIIDIDKESPIGDYYFSVIFLSGTQLESDKAMVGSPGGIGTNVILSVGRKGEIKGEIVKFEAPFLVTSGPVPLTLLLKNNSAQYVTPRGRITIKNMLGKDAGRVDILPQYLLSNSQRYMVDSDQASPSAELEDQIKKLSSDHNVLIWPGKFMLGFYTAQAHVKLSEDGPEFDRTIRFFALPFSVIFAVSFFSFVLIGIYLRIKRKI
jgi:hypothetical protein